jgi:hypothetical protein
MRAPLTQPTVAGYALHYGQTQTPLVRVEPDSVYPGMWRVVWPDGRTSDMVNLARAKDAAMALAERGPPARNPQRLHWRLDRSNSPYGGRTRVLLVGPARHRPFVSSSGKTNWPANAAAGKSPKPGEPLSIKAAADSYSVIGSETGAILKTDLATTSEATGWIDGFDTGRGSAFRQRRGAARRKAAT